MEQPTPFGPYSKVLGAGLGAITGTLVSKYGLPAEFNDPAIQGMLTILMSMLFTYFFPKNKPNA